MGRWHNPSRSRRRRDADRGWSARVSTPDRLCVELLTLSGAVALVRWHPLQTFWNEFVACKPAVEPSADFGLRIRTIPAESLALRQSCWDFV